MVLLLEKQKLKGHLKLTLLYYLLPFALSRSNSISSQCLFDPTDGRLGNDFNDRAISAILTVKRAMDNSR